MHDTYFVCILIIPTLFMLTSPFSWQACQVGTLTNVPRPQSRGPEQIPMGVQIKAPMLSSKSFRVAVTRRTTNNKCWCGCGEREALYVAGGNVEWRNHYGKQYRGFSKIEWPYDPAISHLRTYSKKTKALMWKGIWTPMFVAVLFTVARSGSNRRIH